MKSWRTTLLGILAGVAMLAAEVRDAIDTDPATVFELDKVLTALGLMGLGVIARDDKVTSEEAKAGNKPKGSGMSGKLPLVLFAFVLAGVGLTGCAADGTVDIGKIREGVGIYRELKEIHAGK